MPRVSMLLQLLILSLATLGCSVPGPDDRIPASTSTEVKLTIDTGEPKVTTAKVPYAEKMTVRDVLRAAEAQGITSAYEGEGEGAMLQSLQGIGNEGGGKEAKNWIYYVNGKQGTTSSAVYSLQPGDAIIWRFEKYE